VFRPHGVHQEVDCRKRALGGRKGTPGGCGSFVGVGHALWCFVVLWGRFATDIPRAKLLKINYLKIPKNANFI
jgi:hypothetical protein